MAVPLDFSKSRRGPEERPPRESRELESKESREEREETELATILPNFPYSGEDDPNRFAPLMRLNCVL